MKARGVFIGMSTVLAVTWLAASPAGAQAVADLNLPAEPLADSLTALGAVAHVNIVFAPEAVAGKHAPALKGRFSAPAALDQLLKGSGLNVSATGGGSYVITLTIAPKPDVLKPFTAAETAPLDPPPEPPTVVVTGYRLSLARSLANRRAYSGGLESIVAEDIAKFPDSNVAEAIQRVAGVAISRDQGEGRTVTVRGLGAEFTRVEINGVGAQAVTDGPTQGVNKGRGFDFNIFPSELFSRVDVKKTSGADQPEGSLGATVNLITPHPFDHKGVNLALAVQATYNDLVGKPGRRAAFLFSNTFGQDRFGILFSAAYARTPLDIQGVNSGGWNQGTANGGYCRPTAGTGGICDVPVGDLGASLAAYDLASRAATYAPQFYRYTELIGSVDRFGATASFQWRPSDRTSLLVDVLYSRYSTRRTDHFLEAIGFSRGASQGGKPEIVPRRVVLDTTGTMIYGQFDNVDVRSEQGVDNFTTDFHHVTLVLKHRFSDRIFAEFTAGSSRSAFDDFDELTVQIDRLNVDGYAFDTRATGRQRPVISYGFDLTDPRNWYFGPRVTLPGGTGATGPEIRLRPNYIYNDSDAVQAKVTYDPSTRYRLSFGVQAKHYAYRNIAYRFDQGEADFPAPALPLKDLTRVFCGGITPPSGTPACWLEPDIGAFVMAYGLFDNAGRTSLSTTNTAARGFNQAVIENDVSAFGKVWFNTILWGRPLRGDVGVRRIETHQNAVFYTNVPGSADPKGYVLTSVSRSYGDTLPSFNIVFETDAHSLLRFSAARVMARPPLQYLAAATNVTVDGRNRLVTTGNPNLKPYRATTFDASYELYPDAGGIFSVGLFYKDISTYVQSLTRIAPYSTTGLPASLLTNTGAAQTDDFSISTVVNTPGGPLSGVELGYQQPLKFLPGIWSKFGLIWNYTFVTSRIRYETNAALGPITVVADLLNLSRNSYNATVYYDDGRFQARLSTNYRDKYLTKVPGAYNADAGGIDPATYWDCSLSYRVRPGLSLTLEGLNLTDQKSVSWDNTATRLVGDTRQSGRQIFLGVRYTY
jgi:TonB-dependent receptor